MAPLNPDKNGSDMAELVSTLSLAAFGERDWLKLARTLATTLRGSRLDWRDLARALDQVRTDLFPTDRAAAAPTLDRVALLALQLAKVGTPKVSAEIIDACALETEPEPMLRKMLPILAKDIPFDIFGYSEYSHGSGKSDDSTFVQSRFALDGDEPFLWPARWMAIPPELVAWVEGQKRYITDTESFYAENPEAEALRSHVVTREYDRRGITSFLVAPRMDGGRVAAALTLGRRRNGAYPPFNESDQQRLDAFRIELVLRQVGEAYERRTAKLVQDLVALFTPDADAAKLAQTAVRLLGEGYGLEYLGLFRVNRAHGLFEVVAEHDPHGKLQVPQDYAQPLSSGMLGSVLKARQPLYAPNVQLKPPPYDYIAKGTAPASAMCFPIRLGREGDAEVEWILDLESSQFDAFPRPEQIVLKQIIGEVERSLQSWFEARLGAALLNLVEQGVVVLGEHTRIERANATARKLLGLPRDLRLPIRDEDMASSTAEDASPGIDRKFAELEAFAADDATRASICDGASSAGAHLRLKGPDGIERRVLAGSSYRDEAFNRRVWLLGDTEQKEWIGALRYMEAAVRTVSAQAHGSLRLAGTLLRRVQSGLDACSSEYGLLDRAIRSIAVADLPYERIASVHDVIAMPLRQTSVLDLGATLRQFRNSLPQDDAAALELTLPDQPLVIAADPERLAFALRSLLGYLLALRLPETRLQVSIGSTQAEAAVAIDLTEIPSDRIARLDSGQDDQESQTTDKIAFAEARAVTAAAHGLDAVEAVIEAHGAHLRQTLGQDRGVSFTISGLRLAPCGISSEDLRPADHQRAIGRAG